MLNEFDAQCQELRTRIARSRRRLDRRARDLTDDVTQLFPFSSAAGHGSWKVWAGMLAAGLALSRWSRAAARGRLCAVSSWARRWRAAWTSSRDDCA